MLLKQYDIKFDEMKGRRVMKSLEGKRLLIVSSDGCDIEFVKSAKEMGMYVVCCDRYSDHTISPAKQLADEAWDIDYTETKTVAEKCRQAGIDGVIAGYGEDRVTAACRISREIGTPFYATEEQIDFTRNKRAFKEACLRCGVKAPKEYCSKLPMSKEEIDAIPLPVIVKPSDNGGRKGISVCERRDQLDEAIKYAEEYSRNGEIVIEEFLIGHEMSSVYTLKDGEVSLSCVNDKYASEDENGMTQLCNLVLTPSKHHDQYLKEIDPGIKKLLKEIKAENGVAYFQLMATDNGIYAFEMGYRMSGNNDYKVIRKYNGLDYMKMTLSHSVTGDMGDSLEKDNPMFKEYYCTYVVHLKSGTIGKIDDSAISGMSNIDDISMMRKVGDVILPTNTNSHKSGMIKFTAKDFDELTDTISFINDNFIVLDEDGNDMLMYRFDPERLR